MARLRGVTGQTVICHRSIRHFACRPAKSPIPRILILIDALQRRGSSQLCRVMKAEQAVKSVRQAAGSLIRRLRARSRA